MEDNHIKSFEVSGFKKFTDLEIDNIGQFNLIVGDNNVGKTSLLEALLADRNYNSFVTGLGNINFYLRKMPFRSTYFLSDYFNIDSNKYPKIFNFKLKYNSKNTDEIAFRQNLEHDVIHVLLPSDPNRTLNLNDNVTSSGISFSIEQKPNTDFDVTIPFISFGPLYTNNLTLQYSKNIQLFVNKKEKLLQALGSMLKNIKNIEVSASAGGLSSLLIAENAKNTLFPLGSYGDGTIKFFRILISLFATDVSHSRLMVDEVDTGVHHSRLVNFISSLITVSKEEKKQLFATTHSKECIESFTKALEETGMQNEGRIIRLAETKQGIKAFTMEYDEFEKALMAESEIR
jgi:AAA15 family ATPase/GTPase